MKVWQSLVGVVLMISALPTLAHSSKDPIESLVIYRHALFGLIDTHVEKMGHVVKGHQAYNQEEIQISADVVAALAKVAEQGFAIESAVKGSDAKPDVWKNKEDFAIELQQLIDTSEALANNAGNENDFKTNFIPLVKTCKSCHNKYRK